MNDYFRYVLGKEILNLNHVIQYFSCELTNILSTVLLFQILILMIDNMEFRVLSNNELRKDTKDNIFPK